MGKLKVKALWRINLIARKLIAAPSCKTGFGAKRPDDTIIGGA
jgi:hypothetical protein